MRRSDFFLTLLRPLFWLIYFLRGGDKGHKRRLQLAGQPTGRDQKLEGEIRSQFSFLFDEYRAELISNKYYGRAFGNATIEIACGNLMLVFVRDRGDLGLLLAPRSEPNSTVQLEVVLWSLGLVPKGRSWVTLRDLAGLVTKFLPSLQVAFSPDQIATTWRKLRL